MLSQAFIADGVGKRTAAWYSAIETGKRTMPRKYLHKLAELLDVPLQEVRRHHIVDSVLGVLDEGGCDYNDARIVLSMVLYEREKRVLGGSPPPKEYLSELMVAHKPEQLLSEQVARWVQSQLDTNRVRRLAAALTERVERLDVAADVVFAARTVGPEGEGVLRSIILATARALGEQLGKE